MATRDFLSRFLQRGPRPQYQQPPQQQPQHGPPQARQAPPQAPQAPPQAPQAPPPPQPQQQHPQQPQPQPPPQEQPPPPMPPRRPPTAGQLRRERRALIRAREQAIRDFGGLLLEMYKREKFSEALYLEQGAAIVGIEERIRELDTTLATVTRAPRPEANRCACGAPIPPGAHFCANCGRPVGAEPVVSCAHCGAPLPAEADFCPHCGRPAEPRTTQQASAGQQPTAPPTGPPPAASENVER